MFPLGKLTQVEVKCQHYNARKVLSTVLYDESQIFVSENYTEKIKCIHKTVFCHFFIIPFILSDYSEIMYSSNAEILKKNLMLPNEVWLKFLYNKKDKLFKIKRKLLTIQVYLIIVAIYLSTL